MSVFVQISFRRAAPAQHDDADLKSLCFAPNRQTDILCRQNAEAHAGLGVVYGSTALESAGQRSGSNAQRASSSSSAASPPFDREGLSAKSTVAFSSSRLWPGLKRCTERRMTCALRVRAMAAAMRARLAALSGFETGTRIRSCSTRGRHRRNT